jgi:hypothetical protein
MMSKTPIPELGGSPFAPVEVVEGADLSAADRKVLEEEEAIIEEGKRTFLDVAAALVRIRDYKGGLLYKRYGTWEAYCQERWDFGRSYALRLTDAAEIYKELLPRGNKTGDAVLLTSEKQIRPLKKLPSAGLRKKALRAAVEAAGEGPMLARLVEKAVNTVLREEGLEPKRPPTPAPASFRLQADHVERLRQGLSRLGKLCAGVPEAGKILELIDQLKALLPGS